MKSKITQQTDAEKFKQSLLPEGREKVRWTMETFSTYVNLLYPHITVVPGQEWNGSPKHYKFICSIHGEYSATANLVMTPRQGCMCKGCKTDKNIATAGVRRANKGTSEEKQLVKKLRDAGLSYRAIAKQVGKSCSTICYWLNPESKANCLATNYKWFSANNNELHKAKKLRYYSEFEHAKQSRKKGSHKRRSLQYHAVDVVYLPDHPDADYQGFVEFNCFDLITTSEDRDFWSFAGADDDTAKRAKQQMGLEKISGEKYSLEHLVPLSRGGIHHPANFANRALKLNMQKNNSLWDKDTNLFLSRIFN